MNEFALHQSWGQAAFIGVFLLVLVGLLLLPGRYFGPAGRAPVWWKNTRLWAAIICAVQIMIYWFWG